MASSPPPFGWFTDRHFQAIRPSHDSAVVNTDPASRVHAPTPAAFHQLPAANSALTNSTGWLPPCSRSVTHSSAPADSQAKIGCVTGTTEFGDAPYFTKPSLGELSQMSPPQLQAVHHFTVGRAGLGEVVCERPIDLSSVSLPVLVRQVLFTRGSVSVRTLHMRQHSCRGVLSGVVPECGASILAYEQQLRRRVESSGQLFGSYDSAAGMLQVRIPPHQALSMADATADWQPQPAGAMCSQCHWGNRQGAHQCERCGASCRLIALSLATSPDSGTGLAGCHEPHGQSLTAYNAPNRMPLVANDMSLDAVPLASDPLGGSSRSLHSPTPVTKGSRWRDSLNNMNLNYDCNRPTSNFNKAFRERHQIEDDCETDLRGCITKVEEESHSASRFDADSQMELDLADELWQQISQWLMHAEPEWLSHGGRLVLAILRARSHDLAKSFKLARHFSLYREGHNWPLQLRVHDCRQLLETGVCQLLPQLDDEERAIVLIVGRNFQLKEHPIEAYVKTAHLVLEWAVLRNCDVQRAGICVVLDLDDTAAADTLALQGVIKTMQDTFPCKVKRIYVINAGMMMRFALRIVTKSLKPKLQERIVLLDNLKHLHRVIPQTKLPQELGGSCHSDWHQWIVAHDS